MVKKRPPPPRAAKKKKKPGRPRKKKPQNPPSVVNEETGVQVYITREDDPDDPSEVFTGCTDYQRTFLKVIAVTGQLSKARLLSGISQWSHDKWLRTDMNYRAKYKMARRMAADSIESEAIRRAKDGVVRMRFHQGKPIMIPLRDGNGDLVHETKRGKTEVKMVPYVEHEYSDSLMQTLLKGMLPSRYRERQDIKMDVSSRHRVAGKTPSEVVELTRSRLAKLYEEHSASRSLTHNGNGNGNGRSGGNGEGAS
tara:strand:+ start:3775 stop:4533 length:759 start_codon:yes stop_codon:yes gene_type:complete